METIAQAIFINFYSGKDTCSIGAAVITHEQIRAVGGLLGHIPGPVGKRIIASCAKAGVKVTIVRKNSNSEIIALTWGEFDPVKYWPLVSHGVAESILKNVLDVLPELEPPGGDNEIHFSST
jgi:hypothetical protein